MGEALRHSCERGLKRPSGTGGDQVAQLLRRDARFHSQVIGDVLQPLVHSRHLSLREQVDLQVEVAAFVGLPRQAVLLANTKSARKMASRDTVMVRNGQENGSNGANVADHSGVYGHPRPNHRTTSFVELRRRGSADHIEALVPQRPNGNLVFSGAITGNGAADFLIGRASQCPLQRHKRSRTDTVGSMQGTYRISSASARRSRSMPASDTSCPIPTSIGMTRSPESI